MKPASWLGLACLAAAGCNPVATVNVTGKACGAGGFCPSGWSCVANVCEPTGSSVAGTSTATSSSTSSSSTSSSSVGTSSGASTGSGTTSSGATSSATTSVGSTSSASGSGTSSNSSSGSGTSSSSSTGSGSSSSSSSGSGTSSSSSSGGTSSSSSTSSGSGSGSSSSSSTGGSTGALQAYPAAVLADGPIAYYHLDDLGSGVALDVTGNGHDGTYGNLLQAVSSLVPSYSDDAALFPGSGSASPTPSEYIEVPKSVALEPDAGMSVEAWIEFASIMDGDYEQAVISYGDNFTYPYQPYILQVGGTFDGGIQLLWQLVIKNNGVYCYTNSALTPGVPYYVVGTFDGTNLELYINGALDSQLNAPGPIGHYLDATSTNGLGIGSRYDYNPNGNGFGPIPGFDGTIDEVAIYGAALSPTQVATHWAAAQDGGG